MAGVPGMESKTLFLFSTNGRIVSSAVAQARTKNIVFYISERMWTRCHGRQKNNRGGGQIKYQVYMHILLH